jgi:hypothetical protein
VYFPRENGAGGGINGMGGGVIRIVADRVQVDGAVRADGVVVENGGAGGSVWITTGSLAGGGAITAKGGSASFRSGRRRFDRIWIAREWDDAARQRLGARWLDRCDWWRGHGLPASVERGARRAGRRQRYGLE